MPTACCALCCVSAKYDLLLIAQAVFVMEIRTHRETDTDIVIDTTYQLLLECDNCGTVLKNMLNFIGLKGEWCCYYGCSE